METQAVERLSAELVNAGVEMLRHAFRTAVVVAALVLATGHHVGSASAVGSQEAVASQGTVPGHLELWALRDYRGPSVFHSLPPAEMCAPLEIPTRSAWNHSFTTSVLLFSTADCRGDPVATLGPDSGDPDTTDPYTGAPAVTMLVA